MVKGKATAKKGPQSGNLIKMLHLFAKSCDKLSLDSVTFLGMLVTFR